MKAWQIVPARSLSNGMHLRPFEIGLIVFFFITAIVGIASLRLYQGNEDPADKPYGDSIIIWGTLEDQEFKQHLSSSISGEQALSVVQYIEKDPRTFDTEFVNAIAEGRAPDLVVLPHDRLVIHRSKLMPITYESFPVRTFRDRYIDGADIFMRTDGIYGIPFAVDPLVLYWNRDLFSSAGLATPPKTWEVMVGETVPALVRRDGGTLTLTQTALAFGEFKNVTHAKNILAMLLLQAGNNLVEERQDEYRITLTESAKQGLPPAHAALSFYTQFASAGSDLYTWNRSQKNDRAQFIAGTLGMYIGFGSEVEALRRDNPNLSFDVASMPQGSGATTLRDYGTFYAFAIPRAIAPQQRVYAYTLASKLAGGTHAGAIAEAYDFAPVLRSLHSGIDDPFKKIIYQSALISRGWLDPNPQITSEVFEKMIEEITSGRKRIEEALRDASDTLTTLFR